MMYIGIRLQVTASALNIGVQVWAYSHEAEEM